MTPEAIPTIGDLARRRGRAAKAARDMLAHYPPETRIDAVLSGARGGDRTLALMEQIERVTEPES